MMQFTYDRGKDTTIRKRPGGAGIGFDDIIESIYQGGLLDTRQTSQGLYQGQYFMIVLCQGYCYKVPFTLTEYGYHLITAFPSRKLYKEFIS